jgi:hypothetical protein
MRFDLRRVVAQRQLADKHLASSKVQLPLPQRSIRACATETILI